MGKPSDPHRHILLPRVLRTHVEPGDIIVVEHPSTLSDHDRVTIHDQLRYVFPGHQVLVLTNGAKLQIAIDVPDRPRARRAPRRR
jgi:hypothetical protein